MGGNTNDIKRAIEQLTGRHAPLDTGGFGCADTLLNDGSMGFSQFNEVLLLLGFDRIDRSFFQFLVDGTANYTTGSAITSVAHLTQSVERFQQMALVRFGNISFAFKALSKFGRDEMQEQIDFLAPTQESEFTQRHEPACPIKPIDGNETYYLGYVVADELKRRLEANPTDPVLKQELAKRNAIVQQGIDNHNSYLASDHMDVYVATSMRERHEYAFVHKVTQDIFHSERLAHLKLRWFDPTQAYCVDRIDKGLSEALMLKRAKCTLYLAQETDTLGKDSELASTLAQGKPVIAYVPKISRENTDFIDQMMTMSKELHGDSVDVNDLLHKHARVCVPHLAWDESWVRRWLDGECPLSIDEIKTKLSIAMADHYDRRAKTLQETHPLGIQVNLDTGVANGVLVARDIEQCAELLYRVLTSRLEFNLEEKQVAGNTYLLLRETISGSVFRVASGDRLLTNSFWNFYLY